MRRLSSLHVNITGPSLVLSQALGLWDAHVITPSFKFPAFRSHSVAVIELHWGSRPNTHRFNRNVNTYVQLSVDVLWVIIFLWIIYAFNYRPHKLLASPDLNASWYWYYKQSFNIRCQKKTWLAHISQPWKTISFVSPSWDCEEWHLIHPEMLRLLIKTQTLQLLRYDLLLSPWVGLLKESRCRHKCFRTCKLLGRENPSHSVCRQINPPLSSLIPSESSVVSYYAVLHTAGRWSNPDTNLVYLKSNLKAFWSQGNTRGDVSLSMTGHWAEVCLETQRVCRFMGKYR